MSKTSAQKAEEERLNQMSISMTSVVINTQALATMYERDAKAYPVSDPRRKHLESRARFLRSDANLFQKLQA